MERIVFGIFLMLALIASGCTTRLGPGAIRSSHRPYNDSVIETLNEQLLLNLVRLKYRDNPYFIEVTSITSNSSIEGNMGATGVLPRLPTVGVTAGSKYQDNPVISFQPLQGEEFIQKLMAPVPIQGILKLTESGWSVDRVMRLAVEQANHLHNAPTASGPTPNSAPEFEQFRAVSTKIRQIQDLHGLDVSMDSGNVAMIIDSSRVSRSDGVEVRRRLGLSENGYRVILTDKPAKHRGPDDLFLQTRSVIGILFFLSHNVAVPEVHRSRGLVTVTRDRNGEEFDWAEVTGDLLKVQSSATPPTEAFVKLRYRGHWFYIADNDLESKSTFMLLHQLFNLLAGDIKKAAPVLTIPVG